MKSIEQLKDWTTEGQKVSRKQSADPQKSTTYGQISTEKFFGEGSRNRILQQLEVTMSQHTYLPKIDSPRSDWVAAAAIPAFRALNLSQGAVRNFCAIGTGVGLDALAAVEILGPSYVLVTDLHQDVVDYAATNIRRNLRDASAIEICAYAGELTIPVRRAGMKFDLVYENLPNIPLALDQDLNDGQTSSTFFQATERDRPAVVVKNLLELHFDLLCDVRRYLNEGGRVVSVIGARVPLKLLLKMPAHAGYEARLLVYNWKIQSEPTEVLPAYVAAEQAGLGPFHFYPPAVLDQAFNGLTMAKAADQSLEIEARIQAHAISCMEASDIVSSGGQIGHTLAVVESVPGPQHVRARHRQHSPSVDKVLH